MASITNNGIEDIEPINADLLDSGQTFDNFQDDSIFQEALKMLTMPSQADLFNNFNCMDECPLDCGSVNNIAEPDYTSLISYEKPGNISPIQIQNGIPGYCQNNSMTVEKYRLALNQSTPNSNGHFYRSVDTEEQMKSNQNISSIQNYSQFNAVVTENGSDTRNENEANLAPLSYNSNNDFSEAKLSPLPASPNANVRVHDTVKTNSRKRSYSEETTGYAHANKDNEPNIERQGPRKCSMYQFPYENQNDADDEVLVVPWQSARQYQQLLVSFIEDPSKFEWYSVEKIGKCRLSGTPMQPEWIYTNPRPRMYFLECSSLRGKGSFGFAKTHAYKKRFDWKKTSYVNHLPKKLPVISYITANASGKDDNGNFLSFRMRAVKAFSIAGFNKNHLLTNWCLVDIHRSNGFALRRGPKTSKRSFPRPQKSLPAISNVNSDDQKFLKEETSLESDQINSSQYCLVNDDPLSIASFPMSAEEEVRTEDITRSNNYP